MRLIIILTLFLLGCAGSRPISSPEPVQEPTPAPTVIDNAYEAARARMLAKWPGADLTDFRPILEVHYQPMEGINPASGNAGFKAATVGAPNPDAFCIATLGRSCYGLVRGWTELPPGNPLTIETYVLENTTDVLPHEMMHIFYYLWRPGELCPNPTMGPSFAYIQHGGSCDPLLRTNEYQEGDNL